MRLLQGIAIILLFAAACSCAGGTPKADPYALPDSLFKILEDEENEEDSKNFVPLKNYAKPTATKKYYRVAKKPKKKSAAKPDHASSQNSSLKKQPAKGKPPQKTVPESKVATKVATKDTTRQSTKQPPKTQKKNTYNIPKKIWPLWQSMTLRQKAAQMIMIFMTTSDYVTSNEFGGLLITAAHLRKRNAYLETLDQINKGMRIPPLVALDQEGGAVNRLGVTSSRWHSTPSAMQMRIMDEKKIYSIAEEIAQALKDIKINLNLAPVLDPSIDEKNKPTFMEETKRSWGKDTSAAPKVRAFVKGMKRHNILCASKHFPGYDSWSNSDFQIAASATSREGIAKNILFFKTLSKDIPIIMMSSVQFVRISDRPSVFDPKIVKMARAFSPDIVILTDDLWGASLRSWASGQDRVSHKNYPKKYFRRLIQKIMEADNDMLMISYSSRATDMLDIMLDLAEKNPYYKKKIEASAARIIKLKYNAGILR